MHSEAETVDEYLETLKEERKEAIIKLREIVKTTHPKMEESMKYRMPTYSQQDQYIAFASQKLYISLYIRSAELILKYKNKLGKVSLGKNCIRFRKIVDMKFDVIKDLLEELDY
jgi:uncharacterized protein YdhG (YjbR/CyaY superfamily)